MSFGDRNITTSSATRKPIGRSNPQLSVTTKRHDIDHFYAKERAKLIHKAFVDYFRRHYAKRHFNHQTGSGGNG